MAKTSEVVEVSGLDTSISEELDNVLDAVNLDEVSTDTAHIRGRVCKTVDVLDDEGNPILGEDNKPLRYRKVTGTRVAHIQLIAPMSIYNEAIAMRGKLAGKDIDMDAMTHILLKMWRISEPFMTEQMLIEFFDSGMVMVKVFYLFFDKMTKIMNTKRGVQTENGTH